MKKQKNLSCFLRKQIWSTNFQIATSLQEKERASSILYKKNKIKMNFKHLTQLRRQPDNSPNMTKTYKKPKKLVFKRMKRNLIHKERLKINKKRKTFKK
jgi:hypothetical protein